MMNLFFLIVSLAPCVLYLFSIHILDISMDIKL